ncbi:unnamed protein product [Musa hybrid cultivar]
MVGIVVGDGICGGMEEVEGRIPEEVERRIPEEARGILQRLASSWCDVADSMALEVVPLKGALTNEVYQVNWPTCATAAGKRPHTVLVRIYGEGVDVFFDREEEIRTFECLSRHGQGPLLLGRFPNGRVEEFIHARTLSAVDLRDPEISGLIASKLREFHDLDMPGHRTVLLWGRLRCWLKVAKSFYPAEEIEEFCLDALEEEIMTLENELSEEDQRIGFCHNDLQYGNIMIDEETRVVTIIDYEYASFNPVAYDLANHFCEMAADYHSKTPHILDYSKYPDHEERQRFVKLYLGSSGEKPGDAEVENLLMNIEKYALASHLLWGLWGIISEHVNKIDFDYMEYARQRFQQYWLKKSATLYSGVEEKDKERVEVQYYEPKPGDLVVGVVVSGNENRLDVNVGADMLGTMLTKEVLPLYEAELPFLLCDRDKDAAEYTVPGKMGILKDEEALSGGKVAGRPVVEVGTILFAEVLGRTLSGRPLLSTRRMFRRVAWHRVRQIMQLNEPIEVKIFEWNTGGLLTRIEGLRAFLPKAELMNRIKNFTDLKDNVSRRMYVCIIRIDEATNDLIISEREAWDMMNLKEGTLIEGTVCKILPFGAQIRIGATNRSGLLHISNITRARVSSVSDVLKVDEKVKVLVVKSMFPDKISLSIADLEREPGLFLSDREKVFSEAEEMAQKYRRKLPVISASHKFETPPTDSLPFDDEARLYANWKWFKFEQHTEVNDGDNIISEC